MDYTEGYFYFLHVVKERVVGQNKEIERERADDSGASIFNSVLAKIRPIPIKFEGV